MSSETLLSVRGVSKDFKVYRRPADRIVEAASFGLSCRHRSFPALRGVDIEVGAGESVGLLGANGAGKSTLLQILAGTMRPTSGEVFVAGRLTALLELGAGFIGEVTGRDNAILAARLYGMTEDEAAKRIPWIQDFSGLAEHMDTPIKFYSSGMYARLGFAVAVAVDPDVILIDEALSVGDIGFQKKAEDHLRNHLSRSAKIVVSHDLESIRRSCDRVVVLASGSVVYDGPCDEGLDMLSGGRDDVAAPKARSSGRGRISIELRDTAGFVPNVCRGTTVGIDFELVSTYREEVSCVVGHAWKTRTGASAFGSNTDLVGEPSMTVPPGRSVGRISFVWPSVPDGSYDLLLGVGRVLGPEQQEIECHAEGVFSALSVGSGRFDFGHLVDTKTSLSGTGPTRNQR